MIGIDAETRAFIEPQRVARLATVDERGRPHIVPICFAIIAGVLYTAIDEKPKSGDFTQLRRLRNIAANSHVQVLLDIYDDDDWTRLRFVQLHGSARIILPGDAMHPAAVAALRARYSQYARMSLETRPTIAIDISRVVSWRSTRIVNDQ